MARANSNNTTTRRTLLNGMAPVVAALDEMAATPAHTPEGRRNSGISSHDHQRHRPALPWGSLLCEASPAFVATQLHALGNLMAVRHLTRVCTEMHTMTHPVPAVCLAWDSLFAPSFTN